MKTTPDLFQSPRGDFGFLKRLSARKKAANKIRFVSIPSRGFWFFEVNYRYVSIILRYLRVSIPSRGFWFFEGHVLRICIWYDRHRVSIPSRGFWFFEAITAVAANDRGIVDVSIPSRGFWFFEVIVVAGRRNDAQIVSFNPLAGILVF